MPSQLQLPDGRMHDVGTPVEDPAPEQEAVVDAEAAPEEATEPAITPCRTAFTIYLCEDGEVCLSHLAWAEPVPSRPPTFDEMTFGAAVIRWHVENYSWREPGATETCLTAFTPYLTHDGRWLISADPNDPLVVDREPTNDELVGGLAVVMRDVQTQETLQPLFGPFAQSLVQSITQNVIGNMINIGKQAQDAQEALNVARKLEEDKKRRGGR